MIAACGLDCTGCDIRLATDDPELTQRTADWFDRELGLKLKLEDIRCDGCKGDRAKHWSPDCWILQCCVDDKGLEFCSQCEDFPCQRLNDWAEGSERYSKALERLKEMK